MSILENKSKENYKAIEALETGETYTPIVHCAYYSSLQLIIHYILMFVENDERKLQAELFSKRNGSHKFYIDKIGLEIRRVNSTLAVTIMKEMRSFKEKRSIADYYNIPVLSKDALEAKQKAKKINDSLINFFENERV